MGSVYADAIGPRRLDNNLIAGKSAYGSRLLPQILDGRAASDPDRVYATITLAPSVSDSYHEVTFGQVARATNFFVHWLKGHVDEGEDMETLAYMGLPDLGNPIIFLAAVKSAYKLLLLSPRNTATTNLSLLEQTKCTKLLFASELKPLALQLEQQKPHLKALAVPPLNDLLLAPAEHVPFEKTIEEVRHNPVLILHSSGSTGPPKAIVMSRGTFAAMDAERDLPVIAGRRTMSITMWDFPAGEKYYSCFPPFHLGGFMSMIIIPLLSE
ncbi:hypothetical protein MMC18_008267 [Xylographa bjoerkii]|nr:hypothetical protein [Xylographa bjoerkii]